MQQPYVTAPPYGAGLTQQLGTGYGVSNPGPAGATGVFGAGAIGEALGSAADISNTAQYTPITHAVQFDAKPPSSPLYEGDLVAISVLDPTLPGQNLFLSKATPDDEFQKGAGFVRPLAADLLLPPTAKPPYYATIAWSAAATVNIPTGSPLSTAPRAAGDAVYVTADNGFKLTCKPDKHTRLLGRLLLATRPQDSQASVCLDV